MSSGLSQIDRPSQVYDLIVDAITKAACGSGAVQVLDYSDFKIDDAFNTQVLVEFGEFNQMPFDDNGRSAQYQEIILYAVVSKSVSKAGIAALNLVSELARLANQNRWGISNTLIDEPEKITSQASFLVEGKDANKSIESYEVSFWQLIRYGGSNYQVDPGLVDGGFMLAINPENIDDDAEYRELFSHADNTD